MAASEFSKFLTKFKAGDILYQAGDLQPDFFIINSGKVQLKSKDESLIIVTLTKGDFFGEESLNNEQPALHTAEVIEDADIIKIPFESLVDMIKQNSEIALKILKKLSEKHVRMEDALFSLKIQPHLESEQKKEEIEHTKEEDTTEKIDLDMKAYLLIQRSNRIVQLTKTETFLGRRDYTSGFVPEVDLTEEDEEKYISRKHAKIEYRTNKFYLSEEPGAINGTFLNGTKLTTGVKHELHNEDEITLCHLNMIFKI